jgi:hypothetical protein
MTGQSDEFRDFRKYCGFVIELFESIVNKKWKSVK